MTDDDIEQMNDNFKFLADETLALETVLIRHGITTTEELAEIWNKIMEAHNESSKSEQSDNDKSET